MYKIAINRPITTLMGVLTLIIFGLMSFNKMPVSLFPNVDFPIVTIKTVYTGADPKTIESQITDKIEESISSIDGIDKIISTSSEGVSLVTVQFFLDRKIEEATNDVRDKVSAVILPTDAQKPLVSKLDVGGAAVLGVFVSSNSKLDGKFMNMIDQKIKPKIQRIAGVGAINLVGYQDRELRIFPNPFSLSKYNLSITELNNIISSANLKKSSGKLITNNQEILVKTEGDSTSVEELRNIQIKPGIKLRDIAKVEDSLEDEISYTSLNGKLGVLLEVQKISGANTVDIIKSVKEKLPVIQKELDSNISLTPLNDTSDFILASLNNVKFDLIYGSILAVFIVFVFLRNFTATIVASFAIPTSIIGTFALMDYLGYDLNKMTLIGLTLAIGIFIDDAIVVIENIYKKLESGMDNFDAAFFGIKEVAFSILAISSMLLAVFVPVAFMGGIVGQFFNSFALTVASGVIISYLVAMAFIPAISARLLKKGESRFYDLTEPLFAKTDKMYAKLVTLVVKHRIKTIILTLLVFFGSLSLGKHIGMDFVPKEDKSEFEIRVKAPLGTSLDAMKTLSEDISQKIQKDPIVMYSNVKIASDPSRSTHKATIYVKVKDISQRAEKQQEIIDRYRAMLKTYNKTLFITVAAIPNIRGAGADQPYQLLLRDDDLDKLQNTASKLEAILAEKKGIVDIDTNYELGKPELKIKIDRLSAAKMGVSVEQITAALATALSGNIAISKYEEFGKQYDISLRLGDNYRKSIENLKMLKVKTSNGNFVFLDGLVKFEMGNGPSAIYRLDRQRQITVMADLSGIPLGNAVAQTEANIAKILPPSMNYRYSGMADEMKKSNKAFGVALFLAVILIYLILASLYESLIQPFIIMIALPLSIIGVMLALFISAKSFSLFTMIGIILLIGMVGKNGVLLVDFANNEIKNGKSVDEAIVLAGEKRLRPILMTTFAMVFAMIPLAISTGSGSESNSPMATAVIGGLMTSLILTLIIVPAIYKLFAPFDGWLRKFYQRNTIS